MSAGARTATEPRIDPHRPGRTGPGSDPRHGRPRQDASGQERGERLRDRVAVLRAVVAPQRVRRQHVLAELAAAAHVEHRADPLVVVELERRGDAVVLRRRRTPRAAARPRRGRRRRRRRAPPARGSPSGSRARGRRSAPRRRAARRPPARGAGARALGRRPSRRCGRRAAARCSGSRRPCSTGSRRRACAARATPASRSRRRRPRAASRSPSTASAPACRSFATVASPCSRRSPSGTWKPVAAMTTSASSTSGSGVRAVERVHARRRPSRRSTRSIGRVEDEAAGRAAHVLVVRRQVPRPKRRAREPPDVSAGRGETSVSSRTPCAQESLADLEGRVPLADDDDAPAAVALAAAVDVA